MALDDKTQKQVDKATATAQKDEQKRNVSTIKDHLASLEDRIEDSKLLKALKAEFKAVIARIKAPF